MGECGHAAREVAEKNNHGVHSVHSEKEKTVVSLCARWFKMLPV
jgi:hypothetical protein